MADAKFPLGRTEITPAALGVLSWSEVLVALDRHARGDWGDLDAADQAENERALRDGSRLFSRYHSARGRTFYVITEHDRSVTTVLLSEDY